MKSVADTGARPATSATSCSHECKQGFARRQVRVCKPARKQRFCVLKPLNLRWCVCTAATQATIVCLPTDHTATANRAPMTEKASPYVGHAYAQEWQTMLTCLETASPAVWHAYAKQNSSNGVRGMTTQSKRNRIVVHDRDASAGYA